MFTKIQLIEKGKHYFKNKEIKIMYATTDGNFFYESGKHFADSHAKTNKLEIITITSEDLDEQKEGEDEELLELRKEAKSLKIKGYGIMKIEKLKEKIAENK